jgi:hypothetical protein
MAYAEYYDTNLARHGQASESGSALGGAKDGSAQDEALPSTHAAEEAVASVASSQALGAVTRRAPPDLRLPCMVYAAAGALDASGDEAQEAMAEVRRAPGVLQVVPYAGATFEGPQSCRDGVAVVARGYWLARQMLARLMDQCVPAGNKAALDRDVEAPAGRLPTLAGLTASSAACTAQFNRGRLRVWISTSEPDRVRAAAGRLAGLAPEAVDLRLLGSSDGPMGLAVLVPAIALARELQSAPVQLIVAYELGVHVPALQTVQVAPSREGSVALAA